MIVEDDPDIRECVQLILEYEGYEVVTAANGAEAEAELQQMAEQPCLVLLDLMMPVMSGWELLEHLARDGALGERTRVVVVSSTLHDVPDGPVECIRKPVRVERLIATVRQYC